MRPQLLHKAPFNFKCWLSYQKHYHFFKFLDENNTNYVDPPIWEEDQLFYISEAAQKRQKNMTIPLGNVTDAEKFYSQIIS